MLMKTITPIVARIKGMHRTRVDFHRAEKRLTLQIKAICRRLCGGDKAEAAKLYKAITSNGEHEHAHVALGYLMPFFAARDLLGQERKRAEKALEKAAKQLPVWPWVESVKGVSALTLGQIVGEAGDLDLYANPAKLWKRMGLAVINGERQRKVTDKDLAIEHGYSPQRRSIVWNLGECIVKAQVRKGADEESPSTAIGPYGELYLQHREYERGRVESLAHANNRAKRYVTKRILRDLWRAWRTEEVIEMRAAA